MTDSEKQQTEQTQSSALPTQEQSQVELKEVEIEQGEIQQDNEQDTNTEAEVDPVVAEDNEEAQKKKRAFDKKKALEALTNAANNKKKALQADPSLANNNFNAFINETLGSRASMLSQQPNESFAAATSRNRSSTLAYSAATYQQKNLIADMLANIPDDVVPNAVVIKNINFNISRSTLLSTIKDLGLPMPRALNYHYENGMFRGLAFSNFRTNLEAIKVIIGLNGITLLGRPLVVLYKKKMVTDNNSQTTTTDSSSPANAGSSSATTAATNTTKKPHHGTKLTAELLADAERLSTSNLMRIRRSTMTGNYSLPQSAALSSFGQLDNPLFKTASFLQPPPGTGTNASQNQNANSQLYRSFDLSSEAGSSIDTLIDLSDKDTRLLYDLISRFRRESKMAELNFPSTLDSKQRHLVMLIAERLNLNHETKGDSNGRTIRLYKSLETLLEAVEINNHSNTSAVNAMGSGADLGSLGNNPSFASQFGNNMYLKNRRPVSNLISFTNPPPPHHHQSNINQYGYNLPSLSQVNSDPYNPHHSHHHNPNHQQHRDDRFSLNLGSNHSSFGGSKRSGIYNGTGTNMSSKTSSMILPEMVLDKSDKTLRNQLYSSNSTNPNPDPNNMISDRISENSYNSNITVEGEQDNNNDKSSKRTNPLKVLEQRSAWRMSESHIKTTSTAATASKSQEQAQGLFQIPSNKAVPIVDHNGNAIVVSTKITQPQTQPQQSASITATTAPEVVDCSDAPAAAVAVDATETIIEKATTE